MNSMLTVLSASLILWAAPAAAKTPGFIADAGWPQKLPNNWIIGLLLTAAVLAVEVIHAQRAVASQMTNCFDLTARYR